MEIRSVDNCTDLFNFDNEVNVLSVMYSYITCCQYNSLLLLNGNSFEKNIKSLLFNLDALTENNGKACLPPDFYSEKYDIMFDVFRVNDSEVNLHYNEILKKEREMRNESIKVGMLDQPNSHIINSVDDPLSKVEHTFERYKKQAQRTTSDHISKFPLYNQMCPNVKYKGLFILDETELYYENAGGRFIIHETWHDKEFMEQIYESDCDFVIWFSPCKMGSGIFKKYFHENGKLAYNTYPAVTIVDTRFKSKKYIDYNYENLIVG